MTAAAYRLTGAINPRGQLPAICVPAFSRRTDNRTYVQYVSIDDRALQFEPLEETPWEPIEGKPKAYGLEIGDPALYWITLSDNDPDPLVGTRQVIRPALLKGRWLVDKMDNAFERLDFAQVAGHLGWFSDEATACEAAFLDNERIIAWLQDTLLLSRVRFAVDTVAISKSLRRATRRRLGSAVQLEFHDRIPLGFDHSLKERTGGVFSDKDLEQINTLVSEDVAYRYAMMRIREIREQRPILPKGAVLAAKWMKPLTPSDAQRKLSGNQRGSITLVQAKYPINASTYFRKEFFGSAEWVPGSTRTGLPLETASIRFSTNLFGKDIGSLSFIVTYGPARQARQGNYTSLLHLGPLAPYFDEQDMTGKWLSLERSVRGTYGLRVDHKPIDKGLFDND